MVAMEDGRVPLPHSMVVGMPQAPWGVLVDMVICTAKVTAQIQQHSAQPCLTMG